MRVKYKQVSEKILGLFFDNDPNHTLFFVALILVSKNDISFARISLSL